MHFRGKANCRPLSLPFSRKLKIRFRATDEQLKEFITSAVNEEDIINIMRKKGSDDKPKNFAHIQLKSEEAQQVSELIFRCKSISKQGRILMENKKQFHFRNY